MAAAVLVPPLLGMSLSVWQRWWLAVVLVLLVQPLSPLQAGFWLSFFAVAVLLMAVSTSSSQGVGGRLKRIFIAQLAIFIGLFPVLLVFTGNISLVSPLVNMLAIPYISFIVLPAMVLLMPLIALGITDIPILLTDSMLALFWNGLVWTSQVLSQSGTFGTIEDKIAASVTFEAEYLLLAGVGIVLMLLPKVSPFRPVGGLLCLPLLFGGDVLSREAYKVWVLDVGQGLSVLVRTANHALMFDTAASYPGGSVASSFIIPSANRLGVHSLDWLVVSHGDNDHSGGFTDIVRAFKPNDIFFGSRQWRNKQKDVPGRVRACGDIPDWQVDGVTFRFIQPDKVGAGNENNKSCVLVIENKECRLVLPGDAEAVVEKKIVREHELTTDRYTWLVAGHHGSKTSSSNEWLDGVQPGLVIFSSGYKNRYGHPAKQVLQRLEMRSLPWLDTGLHGAVVLSAEGGGCEATALRQVKWRYWLADSIRQ